MCLIQRLYYRYWGKARSEKGSTPCHLLPYHCLDVTAVAALLWEGSPHLRQTFHSLLGDSCKDLVLFLIALHDLGKFADPFQRLASSAQKHLWPDKPASRASKYRHDVLGYALSQTKIFHHLQDRQIPEGSFQHLMLAVTGHHGKPTSLSANLHKVVRVFSEDDCQAATQWLDDLANLFPKALPLLALQEEFATARASLFLSGFTMVCDWAGSHQTFFPYETRILSLNEYWSLALSRAEQWNEHARLLPPSVSQNTGLQFLFPGYQPKPMQAAANHWQPLNGPHLMFLEDLTGSGKTEAAMVLAHTIMASGDARGLYIGLPTMATADQMYQRIWSCYDRFYVEGMACLVLAHSARYQNQQFTESIGLEDIGQELPASEEPAAAMCSQWIADKSKKSLLAAVGVGTVDQSMLAVLKVKHATMRLFGLMDKVLIIDEVHAYDAYMQKVLENLIRVHTSQGGSTILLSATLPQAQRLAFLNAFQEVLEKPKTFTPSNAYPLFTHLNGQGELTEMPIESNERREIQVEILTEQPFQLIQELLDKGKCVCWIRNSVADAIWAWEAFRQSMPQDQLTLFHARFMLHDRLTTQNEVLRRFDKHSNATVRKGQLVIATQVVEQSLDVDFDEIISDLAPMDLLIQRLGRQQRHPRDRYGNPLPHGPDNRGPRTFRILAPPLLEKPGSDWLADLFPSGQYVYKERIHLLWLTLQKLQQTPVFELPRDARGLIEAVYGESAVGPDALLPAELKSEAQDYAKKAHATAHCFDYRSGYQGENLPEAVATRYDIQTQKLRLALWDGQSLKPLANCEKDPWPNSEVTISQHWFHDREKVSETERAIQELEQSLPDQGRNALLLPLTQVENCYVVTVTRDGKSGCFTYDPLRGALRPQLI